MEQPNEVATLPPHQKGTQWIQITDERDPDSRIRTGSHSGFAMMDYVDWCYYIKNRITRQARNLSVLVYCNSDGNVSVQALRKVAS